MRTFRTLQIQCESLFSLQPKSSNAVRAPASRVSVTLLDTSLVEPRPPATPTPGRSPWRVVPSLAAATAVVPCSFLLNGSSQLLTVSMVAPCKLLLKLQYRHLITAPVDWTSASAWLYKHPWITCQQN